MIYLIYLSNVLMFGWLVVRLFVCLFVVYFMDKTAVKSSKLIDIQLRNDV